LLLGGAILLMLVFVGYISTNLIHLLLPGHENINNILEMIFIFPMVIGEMGFGCACGKRGGVKLGKDIKV
jgi:hypothetical protein